MSESTSKRDIILIRSAVMMLVAAVGFAAAGFIVSPLGEIHDSVLWVIAQFLIYAGSALGITTYIQYQFKDIRKDLNINKGSDTQS